MTIKTSQEKVVPPTWYMPVKLQGRIEPQSSRSQYCIQYQWLQRCRSISFEVAQLLIWRISFVSVYSHREFNQLPMPSQSSLTAEASWLNSCYTHTATAGILSQMILWPFIMFNFCSPATFTKSHSMSFRKDSKTTVIFSHAYQILSQNQKYKLSIIITGLFILKMTTYKALFFRLPKLGHRLMQTKPILCTVF